MLPLLRAAFPRARFLVRLDGGFATPEIFDFLDAEPRLDYVVARRTRCCSGMRVRHAGGSESEVRGETAHVYLRRRHVWDHERRVVIKAESRRPRAARFVVTNLRQTPRFR